MAKAQSATEETTETKTKAAKGTSIPAQSKDLVLRIFDEVLGTEAEGMTDSTVEWLTALRKEILDSSVRGLSAEQQLEKAEADRDAIFLRITVADGKAVFESDEHKAEFNAINTKIANLERKIAKAKAGTDENDEATDEQGEETTD
jgi:ribosome-associated translation inhibitor RaiA